MPGLNAEDMLDMQKALQEKYKEKWGGVPPEQARQKLLWLYGELGEAGDIIKKSGDREIMLNPDIRAHFIEEMCDAMMYFYDVLLCYGVTAEEFETIYREKHRRNMSRW